MFDGAVAISLGRTRAGFTVRMTINADRKVLVAWSRIMEVLPHIKDRTLSVRAKDQSRVLKVIEPFCVKEGVATMIQIREMLWRRSPGERKTILKLWKEVRKSGTKKG